MALLNEKDVERFLSKILIGLEPDDCWIWVDAVSQTGYGYLGVGGRKGRKIQAHRISYQLFKGKFPGGLQTDHLCRNRRCVNPDHLEAVTHRENLLRGNGAAAQNAKKTHCPRGHDYSHVDNLGRRMCRTCANARRRERYNLQLTDGRDE